MICERIVDQDQYSIEDKPPFLAYVKMGGSLQAFPYKLGTLGEMPSVEMSLYRKCADSSDPFEPFLGKRNDSNQVHFEIKIVEMSL